MRSIVNGDDALRSTNRVIRCIEQATPSANESRDGDRLWYSRESDLFEATEVAHESDGMWISAPYSVCMEIGQQCNFRCGICISDSSPLHQMETDWVSTALKQINEAFGSVRVVWSGGEPTLALGIEDLIDRSRRLGNCNVLVTNASRFISHIAADWIDISVYGYSNATFERYTNSSLFETFRRNLDRYVTAYPRVSASFILGVHGPAALKAMVRMVLDSGVRRLKFHRLSLAGRNLEDHKGDSASSEVLEIQSYLNHNPVVSSFTRSTSSNHKRKGYWVARYPGVLANCETAIPLDDSSRLVRAIKNNAESNVSLYK